MHSNDRPPDFWEEQSLHLPNDDTAKLWFFDFAADKYSSSGDLTDLDKAISLMERASNMTHDRDVFHVERLQCLGTCLVSRFRQSQNSADIDRAIMHMEHGLAITPDGQEMRDTLLHGLAIFYQLRFDFHEDVEDIHKAISYQEERVRKCTTDDHDKASRIASLGTALFKRFTRSFDFDDLDRAISAHETVIGLVPDGDPYQSLSLHILGIIVKCQFERSANPVDIDRSISYLERAAENTPEGHVDKPKSLASFGDSLLARFQHSGNPVDLDRCISAHEKALELTPDGHADKPTHFNNIGHSLASRFEHSGNIDDIDRSVSAHEKAVELLPDGHSSKASSINNLGLALKTRFIHLGNRVDLDRAISALELCITFPECADTRNYFGVLGDSYLIRFEYLKNLDDVDRAIAAHKKVIELLPDDHAQKLGRLGSIGFSYQRRFEHSKDIADLQQAILHFSSAATCVTGKPSTRFGFALRWARMASLLELPASLDGFEVALELIPLIAWLGETITSRHTELVNLGGVAREAAAAAIECGQLETAVEWLEQGRSIVWGQLLDLRTPFNELHNVNAVLADDLKRVSKALENASTRENSSDPSEFSQFAEEAARTHRQLADEWNTLLARVRALPGFEDFLRPLPFSKLSKASESGPVVLINTHETRCDALIIVADLEVIHVPLPFSLKQAQELQRSMNQLLRNAGVRKRDKRVAPIVTTESVPDGGFGNILSILWTSVVKPVLDTLAYSVSRVCWSYAIIFSTSS